MRRSCSLTPATAPYGAAPAGLWRPSGGNRQQAPAGRPVPAVQARNLWEPGRWRLASVVDGSRLANDGDFDLAGVLERLLDLLHHVTRQAHGADIVDLLGPDDDAHLAASLDGEGPLDPLEGVGYVLQRLEALHVVLDRFTARTGASAGDGIGRLDEDRLHRLGVGVGVVVIDDRLGDLLALAEAAREIGSDHVVRRVDLGGGRSFACV